MKSVQRIISMILALSLILEFCPQAALAAETEQTQETEIAVTARETTLETTAPAEAVTEPVEETATPTEAAKEPVEEDEVPEAFASGNAEVSVPAYNSAAAPTIVKSGKCHYLMTWKLDSEGTLTLSSKNPMYNYTGDIYDYNSYSNLPPWVSDIQVRNAVKKVVLEEGITTIGDKAFTDVKNLESISIPDSVTKIGYMALRNTNLGSVVIPDTVTSIGDSAFSNCTNLSSVTLSSNLTSIGAGAFAGCGKIDRITLPESLTSIGNEAFYRCGMQEITIPESITEIGDRAFAECNNLTKVIIPDSVANMGGEVFSFCANLDTITLSKNLTSIGERAFYYCKKLSSILIPDGVTQIGDSAFYHCDNLTSITIPASVTSIGDESFRECGNVTDVYYQGTQEQWEALKANWGMYNEGLWNANIHYNYVVEEEPEDISGTCGENLTWSLVDGLLAIGGEGEMITAPGMGNTPWYDYRDDITRIVIQEGVTSIGYAAFWGLSNLFSVEIPGSVAVIGRDAFGQCTTLGSVKIPEGVTSIQMCAFSGCSSLKRVELPKTIKGIQKLAFEGCFALESVVIPEGVAAIEECTFQGCYSLANLYIPASVTSIGQNALACSYGFTNPKAQDVYFGGNEEQWEKISTDAGLWSGAVVHFNSTGLGDDPPVVEIRPSYGAEKTISTGAYSEVEMYYLNNYLTEWKKAYDDFISKVDACLKEFNGAGEESKETSICQEAARMRKYDKEGTPSRGKYLTMMIGDWSGSFEEKYEEDAYHALATFFYDNISASVPNLSAIDLAKPEAANKIAEAVMKNIDEQSGSYKYGHVTYSISGIDAFGSKSGIMTVSIKGKQEYLLYVCTTQTVINETINAYLKEMKELAVNSAANIANAVFKDILGVSLDQLTSNVLSAAVASIEGKFKIVLSEMFGEAGVGEDLIDRLNYYHSIYSYAKGAIKVGTAQDISTALSNIKALEYKDKKISDSAANNARSALKKAYEKLLRALQEQQDGILVEKEQSFWRWLFGCPVSISVYNSSGEQIGYVGEDDLWYTDDISITELGGVKEIVSFTEDELSFVVTATDYGTMSCMFEQYDEDFAPVGRLNYYNVILEPEQTFQVSVPETLEEENETAAITSGGEVIYPDEYISAEDSAGVTISCSAVTEDGITGGTVSGTGTYIRGDSVILRAEPYEGFRFVGWFDGEYLMGTETIYEFPARENCEISARFYKQKPILIQLEADVGGGAIGGGRYDSGETVTLIALPQSGYRFDGWYVGEELVSTDEEYSFQAAESLILHAAFLHTAVKGDLNEDGAADIQDAVYLIWNTLFPDLYPITADADFNNDGIRNSDDAVILLWHAMFPEQYPLT